MPKRSTFRLPLRPEPKVEAEALKRRDLALIPSDLRRSIRGCVAGESPWPLVWLGSTGTGKTCAGLCVLDYAGGRYWAIADLCDQLREADSGRLENRQGYKMFPRELWQRVSQSPLVVLDELGCRDRVSDFQYETAKRVLDKRQGRPLIVISNLPLKSLAELYDDRFASRLAEGTVLDVSGEDRRLKIAACAN